MCFNDNIIDSEISAAWGKINGREDVQQELWKQQVHILIMDKLQLDDDTQLLSAKPVS